MSRLLGENDKNVFFSHCSMQFSSNSSLQIWTSEIFSKDISKPITASSLRFGHMIEVVK